MPKQVFEGHDRSKNKQNRRTHAKSKTSPFPRTKREAQVLDKVLAAISLSRREGLDLRSAAKIEGTRLSTIRRYAPSVLEKHKGKYRVKTFDRIPRSLNVVGPKGMQTLGVRSSRSASKISRYMNAVRNLIYKNDPSGLAQFRGKSVAGLRLITNVAKLRELADAGLLALDQLYAGVTRGR
ncbi:MAG TPA: hypothetical protein VFW94_10170 [Candidatus Acidoferrales bacterium]|nr:hypothetical protein [Candidatus Acidoferrales bacterium]